MKKHFLVALVADGIAIDAEDRREAERRALDTFTHGARDWAYRVEIHSTAMDEAARTDDDVSLSTVVRRDPHEAGGWLACGTATFVLEASDQIEAQGLARDTFMRLLCQKQTALVAEKFAALRGLRIAA